MNFTDSPFSLTTDQDGEAVLALKTRPRDLSSAENVDHIVTVSLQLGISRFTHSRTWLASAGHLGPDASNPQLEKFRNLRWSLPVLRWARYVALLSFQGGAGT